MQAVAPKESKTVNLIIETNKGKITLELYPDKAPATVSNMLSYVDNNFYDGTIFHRVIDGFMIQGGGFTRDMLQKRPNAPIKNEADNGLRNERGTIAMARTSFVDSATSQFFINLVDNSNSLNFKAKTDAGYGYCVFGRVIGGMDVVDLIAKSPTGVSGRHRDVPTESVIINSIRRQSAAATENAAK
ncbi:MAG: peptidylprolyl isomerase [Kiritimatiellae bacterium]|nr:peptidylprolyl isomerase [Kiritimatiellia bacterium]